MLKYENEWPFGDNIFFLQNEHFTLIFNIRCKTETESRHFRYMLNFQRCFLLLWVYYHKEVWRHTSAIMQRRV